MSKSKYLRPSIQTLSGRHIVERMGPVSCGSGIDVPHPTNSTDPTFNNGSLQHFEK